LTCTNIFVITINLLSNKAIQGKKDRGKKGKESKRKRKTFKLYLQKFMNIYELFHWDRREKKDILLQQTKTLHYVL